MLFIRPVFRTAIVSILLSSLIVYLGLKYHWGDHLRKSAPIKQELQLPDAYIGMANDKQQVSATNEASLPQIVFNEQYLSLIASMNKEQVADHCLKLLSKSIPDKLNLELAVGDCVVSNYQESYYEVVESADVNKVQNENTQAIKNCRKSITHQAGYSIIEKQLLIGICVSSQTVK